MKLPTFTYLDKQVMNKAKQFGKDMEWIKLNHPKTHKKIREMNIYRQSRLDKIK